MGRTVDFETCKGYGMMTDNTLYPNTFQSPNIIIDDGIMALLDGNEVKCLVACQRKILGWEEHRITKQDRISISQLCQMTGLSRQAVIDKMAELDRANLVKKIESGTIKNATLWELNMGQLGSVDKEYLQHRNEERREVNVSRMEKARAKPQAGKSDLPVSHTYQSMRLTEPSKSDLPNLVSRIDTQNPIKLKKLTIGEAIASPPGGNTKPSQRQKSNREIAIDHLQIHFSKKSGIPLESDFKARNKLWRGPLGRLLDAVDCDVGKTQRLIDLAVDKMRSDGLTFSDPNSIYKVAVAKIPEIGQNGRKVVVV